MEPIVRSERLWKAALSNIYFCKLRRRQADRIFGQNLFQESAGIPLDPKIARRTLGHAASAQQQTGHNSQHNALRLRSGRIPISQSWLPQA